MVYEWRYFKIKVKFFYGDRWSCDWGINLYWGDYFMVSK